MTVVQSGYNEEDGNSEIMELLGAPDFCPNQTGNQHAFPDAIGPPALSDQLTALFSELPQGKYCPRATGPKSQHQSEKPVIPSACLLISKETKIHSLGADEVGS